MAETNARKRPIGFVEASTVETDDFLLIDGQTSGTRKIKPDKVGKANTSDLNNDAGFQNATEVAAAIAANIDDGLDTAGKAADSKAVGDALATKVDAASGKGLSTNDYTTAEKTKLAGVATGATRVLIDSGLSESGKAADAGAVGAALDGKVSDVKIGGASVVSDGDAVIPYASESAGGVVKVDEDYGFRIDENGTLKAYAASDSVIKAGTNSFRPVASNHVHDAAFYGLAKAAGDTSQASSSNPVGTYTDTAKKKIQDMVGVTEEITHVKQDINENVLFFNDARIDLKDVKFWAGGTISGTGAITDNRDRSNIYTPGLLTFPLRWEIASYSLYALYLVKYKNGTFVSRESVSGGTTARGLIEPDDSFDGYRLMYATGSFSSYTVAQMVETLVKMVSFREYTEDIESATLADITADTLKTASNFRKGYYASNGEYYTTATQGNITSRIFMLTTVLNIPSTMMYNVVKFNNGIFVSRGSWVAGANKPVIIDEPEYCVMIAMRTTVSEYTVDEILNQVTYFASKVQYSANMIDEIAFINAMNCTWTGSKICHYSVDDVYAILKDLTDNANTYTSIFDNPTLSTLLSIHNDTGMCITLNCFNLSDDAPAYSIANVPEKAAFKTEFQANKNWLKFAFHAESTTTDYSTATGISAAYDTFVTAIYKLTGDYDCIDKITRLGYFGGTLQNVLAIKNKTHGIIGLLCADTTNRASYYLSDTQNDIVQQKGMCLDAKNQLVFLKTITRNLGDSAKAEINGNLCYQKYVELFSHEYESSWLASCRTMCQWAKDNGYVFAFPSTIFNVKSTF